MGAPAALAAFALGLTSAEVATWRAPPQTLLPTHAVTLTGMVRGVDPLPEGRRLLLEAVHLDGAEAALPRLVRVRLRTGDPAVVSTGDTVCIHALLRTLASPAYHGGWDVQRDAFVSGLGGSDFALGLAQRIAAADPAGLARRLQLLRERVGARFIKGIPGAAGTVAATLFIGLAGAIPPADHQAFRDSGLAHLLAVAGLHIGIVMGWTMFLTRAGLALCERSALHWPTKQIVAFVALAAGGGYVVLTGEHVPIARSFAMAMLYTLAVLPERRAISLRGLGLAGVILMLTELQEVPGVSFQMSFAAVLALISSYEVLRPRLAALHGQGGWRGKLTLHLAMLSLTSFLAGTASAPIGAYHFGRVQVYFVASNIVAVPLTAFWVMPLGLLALALMPVGLGLDRLAMLPMGWRIEAILWVARTTAALPTATLTVSHAPAWRLALAGLGMAWLGLWRSRIRLAGIAVLAVGLASPLLARPADVLVSADGRLIAVRTTDVVFAEQGNGALRFIRDDRTDYWGADAMRPMPKVGAAADGAVVCDAAGCLLRPRAGAVAALMVRGKVRRHPAAPPWSRWRLSRRVAFARSSGRRWSIGSLSGGMARWRCGCSRRAWGSSVIGRCGARARGWCRCRNGAPCRCCHPLCRWHRRSRRRRRTDPGAWEQWSPPQVMPAQAGIRDLLCCNNDKAGMLERGGLTAAECGRVNPFAGRYDAVT